MESEPDELLGNAARDFADEHLEQVDKDLVNWTIEYRDRRDGSVWLMDYPHRELQGGGPPRLRKIGPAAGGTRGSL